MHWKHLGAEGAQGHIHVGAVWELRSVREDEQRILAEELNATGHGQDAPQVRGGLPGLVVGHHDVGPLWGGLATSHRSGMPHPLHVLLQRPDLRGGRVQPLMLAGHGGCDLLQVPGGVLENVRVLLLLMLHPLCKVVLHDLHTGTATIDGLRVRLPLGLVTVHVQFEGLCEMLSQPPRAAAIAGQNNQYGDIPKKKRTQAQQHRQEDNSSAPFAKTFVLLAKHQETLSLEVRASVIGRVVRFQPDPRVDRRPGGEQGHLLCRGSLAS
mmetsp:Transcript_61300/g.175856  ORF Transcript_61300/g.175856 Transcript_61300/m.175856 type:complete len:267 (+) Transcript_61300:1010-1810(+)